MKILFYLIAALTMGTTVIPFSIHNIELDRTEQRTVGEDDNNAEDEDEEEGNG